MLAKQTIVAAFLVVILCEPSPAATIIYSGSALPQDEGWLVNSFEGGIPGGSTVEKDIVPTGDGDAMAVSTTGTWVDIHEYQTEYVQFVATFRIHVTEAQHNSFDAGLMISGLSSIRGDLDRANSLYLLSDRIGFMEDNEPAYFFEPNQYHDFSLKITDTTIDVFVDESVDAILEGGAVAVLSRPLPRVSHGIIYFGDQCNEDDVNSIYSIDYVRFDPISMVPEPSGGCLTLIASCSGLVAAIRRRRSSALM